MKLKQLMENIYKKTLHSYAIPPLKINCPPVCVRPTLRTTELHTESFSVQYLFFFQGAFDRGLSVEHVMLVISKDISNDTEMCTCSSIFF